MAELGAVYDVSPVPRCPEDIMAPAKVPAPVARAKWLTASVTDDIAEVIKTLFDETDRRDPGHRRTWVALVDGARHQISCIKAEAKARDVNVTIVVDFIHVLEYIWGAARCFFPGDSAGAEAWVKDNRVRLTTRRSGPGARTPKRGGSAVDRTVPNAGSATAPATAWPPTERQTWTAQSERPGSPNSLVPSRGSTTQTRWRPSRSVLSAPSSESSPSSG
jgi:hypothetical protein